MSVLPCAAVAAVMLHAKANAATVFASAIDSARIKNP
jgi:hypothetical protein